MLKWKIKNKNAGQILFVLYSCVLFIGTAIRIFDNAFWGDECFTIRMAHLSLRDMFYATSVDVHPPLYYMLVQVGYHLLGNHGYVYHLVSVIPLLITLLLCLTILQKRLGTVTAVLFATFSAAFPVAMVYNLEARMYSWAALFVLLCFLKVADILEKGRWSDYILFALYAVLAAYTHYYAMIAVAFFYLFLLVRVFFFQHAQIVRMLVACVGTVIAYLPWVIKFLLSFQRTAESWWLDSVPTVRDCGVFLFGNDALTIIFVVVLIVLLVCLGREGKLAEQQWIGAGICAVAGLLLTGKMASCLIRPLFITRYMYTVASVAWLMFALGIGYVAKRIFRNRSVLAGILISAAFICGFAPEYVAQYKEEKSLDAATAQFLEQVQLPEHELILTDSGPHAWTILEYYYPTARIGETYDMVSSINENQSDCTVIVTSPLNEEICSKLSDIGFEAEQTYAGELGIRSMLYVYNVTRKEN